MAVEHELVILEGPVAVGKSSVMEAMATIRDDLKYFPEPLSEWEQATLPNGLTINLLQRFYDNPHNHDNSRDLQVTGVKLKVNR